MALLRPFKALRPDPGKVASIAAVPYDVVDRDEAAQLADGNPLSFLHVSRAEIDLPVDTDPYDGRVYGKARENFEALRRSGDLIVDETPCCYVYRLRMGDHLQTGIAATFSVGEYDADQIKKHEKTRKAKEDDRTRHIITLRAQTGPVFLTYRPRRGIDQIVESATAAEPLYDFTAPDGVGHTLWRLESPEDLVAEFGELPCLYIADGHHRAASASRARSQLMRESFTWSGTEDANFFLAVAFPADQVQILAYNRIVYDLGGKDPDAFLAAVKAQLPVSPGASPEPSRAGHCSMYLGGNWYDLDLSAVAPSNSSSPAEVLDAALLQKSVLEAVLEIGDIRTDPRVDFVGGIRGTGELVRLVDSGKAKAAFSMYPTSLDQLMAISDANEIMPPKSTWFEPKLRDGLVSHLI